MAKQKSYQPRPSRTLPKLKTTGKPLNPVERENWIFAEPKTREEMDQWLEDEKQLILAYMNYYKALSQDETARQRIAIARLRLDEAWNVRGPEDDVKADTVTDSATLQRRIDAYEEANEEWKGAVGKTVEYLSQNVIDKRYRRAQNLWDGKQHLTRNSHYH